MSDLSDKRLELERLGYVRVNAWQASAVEPEIYAAPPKVDDEGRALAPHHYVITSLDGVVVGELHFQQGAPSPRWSGVVETTLMQVCAHRLEAHQAGRFSSREGALQLTKIQEALMWARARVEDRARRGVFQKPLK